MFAAVKVGDYENKPVMTENLERIKKVKKNKVSLVIPFGWGVKGLTDAEKIAKR